MNMQDEPFKHLRKALIPHDFRLSVLFLNKSCVEANLVESPPPLLVAAAALDRPRGVCR
jgi:hypothetical protein